MTEQEVLDYLAAQGIDANVARQEAKDLSRYDNTSQIAGAVPNLIQRSQSGNAAGGGYNTNQNDPAVTRNGATAAARTDSWFGAAGTGGAASYGSLAGGGASSAAFGAAPAPFGETYQPLTWNETFAAPVKPTALQTPYMLPTKADLESSAGYLAGSDAIQRGLERSAASKGSILSGGFVGRTLPRALGDYAGSAYSSLVGNTLAARGQVQGEYSTDVSNAFQQYQQRYGQFNDKQASNLAGYGTRYQAYLDQAGLKRQSEADLWGRNMDTADLSLRAAALARP